jgi:TatD DNase family protein
MARAQAAGVKYILTVGTGKPDADFFLRARSAAEQYGMVYFSLGVHPHDAKDYDEGVENSIKQTLKASPKSLAWGEIGLDYYYEHSPPEVQRDVFSRQLRAAKELNMPVIIHSREADAETIETLQTAYGPTERAGVMHCFGGGPALADAALDLGFMISFAGNVTFKKAENLREAARRIPLDRLLVETDCPYLTPVPFRGQRNEPARARETLICLADLLGVAPERLAQATTENFQRFFRLGE